MNRSSGQFAVIPGEPCRHHRATALMPAVLCQVVQCFQLTEVSIRLVNARQNVDYGTVGGDNVSGDIAVQGTLQNPASAEIYRDYRHFMQALPDGLVAIVYVLGYIGPGEQHGSCQLGVRSAEFLVETAQHVEEQHRLAGSARPVEGLAETFVPVYFPRQHRLTFHSLSSVFSTGLDGLAL